MKSKITALHQLVKTLEAFYTPGDLKEDLFEYLALENKSIRESYPVEVFNTDDSSCAHLEISRIDDIKVLKVATGLNYSGDLSLNITIGIGKFTASKISADLFEIEKCLARLSYNDLMELFDIEFYINNINKMELS